jgi:aryl-alcohol dehydrogenase-like predicted oxidoreductase
VIDLYQLRWPDEKDVQLDDTWAAVAGLVDSGLVRCIGVSNFTEELIERCERIRHVDSLQPQLSMLWQERRQLLDGCVDNDTGVIAYGPLDFGLLTGAINRETRFPADDWRSGNPRSCGKVQVQYLPGPSAPTARRDHAGHVHDPPALTDPLGERVESDEV